MLPTGPGVYLTLISIKRQFTTKHMLEQIHVSFISAPGDVSLLSLGTFMLLWWWWERQIQCLGKYFKENYQCGKDLCMLYCVKSLLILPRLYDVPSSRVSWWCWHLQGSRMKCGDLETHHCFVGIPDELSCQFSENSKEMDVLLFHSYPTRLPLRYVCFNAALKLLID